MQLSNAVDRIKGYLNRLDLLIRKVTDYLQIIAAIWLVFVALTIAAEVAFRNFGLFLGADQIVQNSVPAIVFLQVPFAIVAGTMLRTTILFGFVKKRFRMSLNFLSYVIGFALFLGIAVGGWSDMIRGWEIKEYQGIGAVEFPVYIIRTVIVFASLIVTLIYVNLASRALLGTDNTPLAQDPNEQVEPHL
ncbi:MAG: TRAP transporter small permease subunit [Hyphomicrobiales bacterium]